MNCMYCMYVWVAAFASSEFSSEDRLRNEPVHLPAAFKELQFTRDRKGTI